MKRRVIRARLCTGYSSRDTARGTADQRLDATVQAPLWGLSGKRGRHWPHLESVAAAAREPARIGKVAGDVVALGEPHGEGHGVRRPAEELGPFALALARHLVGKEADRFAALEREQELAHARRVGRRELHIAAPAALAHQRSSQRIFGDR
jgi:hypothetical protein